MALIKDKDEPIYTISIAAKLVRPLPKIRALTGNEIKPIHAQTLRMYDRLGLVKPRKVGKNRFYSDRDIERLQQIQHFTQDNGINLPGVAFIFSLLEQMQQEQTEGTRLESMLQEAERACEMLRKRVNRNHEEQ
jgi:MerR family transcriptional regulator/heat shock protein HspR